MLDYLYYSTVLIGTVLFCFGVILTLKLPFFRLATLSVKQLDIIVDDTFSEEHKDRLILQNLSRLLKCLFICLAFLIVLIVIGISPAALYLNFKPEIEADTSSVYFYFTTILGSFSILFFKKKGDYSYWSKLLHSILLDNYALGRFLLKKEIKKYTHKISSIDKDFLIITGLARAGTTALTNLLFEEDKFHSIKYSDVPFLLAPKFWNRIYKPKATKKRERSHGDRVLFSEASIEALEEYFFKAHLNDNYIKKETLLKHKLDNDLILKYYQYQELFNIEDTLYLAKNNNFILRYESLREKNKLFKVVLIFRKPLDHAMSLLQQHNNFSKRQEEDDFILKYMNWLGHYEFGLNQKYFALTTNHQIEKYNKSELSYWLSIWISYHEYLLKIYSPDQNLFLVDYIDLAKHPTKLKEAIGVKIGVKLGNKHIESFKSNKPTKENITELNEELLKKAMNIYHQLVSCKTNTI